MKQWLLPMLTSGVVAFMAIGVAACGDDSSTDTSKDGGSDAQAHDGGHPVSDGGNPSGDDGGTDGGGKCNFASYVIGLTQQPGTATPDPTLGANCADTASTTTQADFASLFP